MKKLRRRHQEPEDFAMAPMIDMVFLLLVFFMTVASVAKSQRTVELDLPESEESKIPEDASGRGLLSVDADGIYYIGDEPRSLDEIKASITERIRQDPKLQIQIRADRATEYAAVQKLLKTAAESGAYEIIYATYEAR
ncbi:MAG: ExbD/TolR family protein [Puniceicoccaceae bacterium]